MCPAPSESGRVAVGHPVDVASGHVFTACDDVNLAGPEFVWTRYYTTADLTLGPFGIGWRASYAMSLRRIPGGIVFSHLDGDLIFSENPAGGAMVSPGHKHELIADAEDYRMWDWANRVRYHFAAADGDRWRLASIETHNGARSECHYDDRGLLVEVEQLPVRRILLRYDGSGRLETIAMRAAGIPDTLLARFEYDSADCLIAAYDRSQAPIRYAYDSRRRMVRETGRLGASFCFEYDSTSRCVHTFGDNGFGERWLRYQLPARRTDVEDKHGNVWTYLWNAQGQVTREVDPFGAAIERFYGVTGELLMIHLPNEAFIRFEYDDIGLTVAITDELNRRTTFEYDDLHLLVKLGNPDGTEKHWKWGARGSLIEVLDEGAGVWTYERDHRGRLTAATTPNGHLTEVNYREDSLQHELRDEENLLRFTYNAFGDLIESNDAEGLLERRSYDVAGNLEAVIESDGSTYSFEYNADGDVTAERDELARVTRYSYSPLGDITRVVQPDGTHVDYGYDDEGRLALVVNENGDRCTLVYNAVGDLVNQTFFDGRTERYGYDLTGYLVSIVNPDGSEIRQVFDRAGNLLEQNLASGMLRQYEYDARNRIVRAKSPEGVVELAYDSMGRLVRETEDGKVVLYSYDVEGNRTLQHFTGGAAGPLRYEYDLQRRLRSIQDQQGPLQEFEYDRSGRLVRRRCRGGIDERYSYDPGRRIAGQEVYHGGRRIASRRYRYDPAGCVVAIEDERTGAVRYSYDVRGRLTGVHRAGARDETYAYDAAGNLTAIGNEALVSQGNRMLGGGPLHFEYDTNGGVVLRADGAAREQLEYNDAGQLTRVETNDGGVVETTYDAFRRRLTKTQNTAVTRYLWAGNLLTAEARDSGLMTEYLVIDFQPLAQFENGRWLTIVSNQLGVPHEVIDDAGHVVWTGRYTGFARLAQETGSGPRPPFRLPGQYADEEIRLHYNRYRYYDPEVARFTTPDPIGLFGGLNEYRYAEEPVNWEDPLGLKCKLVHFKIKFKPKYGTLKEWKAKRDAFNRVRANPKAKIPSASDYKNRIRPAADKEAASARTKLGLGSSEDADHPGDVRATSLLGQQLEGRDSSVNRSWGGQVGRQAGQRGTGSRTPMADLVDDNGRIIK